MCGIVLFFFAGVEGSADFQTLVPAEGGMTTTQNFMILGIVLAIVAVYVRSRMRSDAKEASEKLMA